MSVLRLASRALPWFSETITYMREITNRYTALKIGLLVRFDIQNINIEPYIYFESL